MTREARYTYKITATVEQEQGEYLENLVKAGEYESISHALRSAITLLKKAGVKV